MMMTLVNMDAPGITILPTHRVVFGLTDTSTQQFLDRARPYFDVTALRESAEATGSDAEGVESASGLLQPLSGTVGVAFQVATPDGMFLLQSRPEAVAAALAHVSARQRALDVVQLHALVLEQILGLTAESIREQRNLRYLRSAPEAVAQVRRGEANFAFLIKPVDLGQMRDISLSGEVMPQKSTDFYPKLLSGLAIYALDSASGNGASTL